jgi:hypothetical protein
MRSSYRKAVLLVAVIFVLVSCGNSGATTPPTYTLSLGAESTVLDAPTRTADGWRDGPPDGTIGALPQGAGQYMFFMAANSSTASAPPTPRRRHAARRVRATCTGTPKMEGTFRMGGTLSSFSANYGCTAVVRRASGGQPDPNGWTFDRDYAGGGPVLTLTSGSRTGVLHVYHGEYHSGTCAHGNSCFYSALGAAFSTDGGNTFQKMGEIVQPYVTRAYAFGIPEDIDVGGGTLLLADANGNYVSNVTSADPSTIYLYVFYADLDPALTDKPCSKRQCLAVARAKLSDVITAAFSNNTAAFPTLFTKYYNGGFTQPATSGEPNAANNSGHYTPVVADYVSFPSVIYDAVTQNYVMAYGQGNDSVVMRHGPNLLSWSSADAAGSFSNAPNGELYPTLIGESGNPTVANGNPILFYVKDSALPGPNFWPDASLVERTVHLSLQ